MQTKTTKRSKLPSIGIHMPGSQYDEPGVRWWIGWTSDMLFYILAGIIVTSLTVASAYYYYQSPGGLAGIVARILAQACSATGRCDLNVLFPAFAIANIILASMAATTLILIRSNNKIDQVDDRHDEVIARLSKIDERVYAVERVLDDGRITAIDNILDSELSDDDRETEIEKVFDEKS